jgi:hypothetical protein
MRLISILALVVIVAGAVTPASAGRSFGIQGGYGFDLDWFIGARAELETAKLFKNSRSAVDFNWYFPGGSFNYFDFNVNYLWPLMTVIEGSNSNIYIGAGLNVGRGWIDNIDNSSNWEFGLNLLGGFNYHLGEKELFFEGGYNLFSDFDQWHIKTGFLF